jgi:S-adenosylmethionine-diacylglycerol 3-amino-3-carboxypropyl transferase
MVQDLLRDTTAAHLPISETRELPVSWARDSILFSSCNEDSGSELRAFGDLSGKHVLCITAGGGRVLNLLVGQPDVIWAVDLNPVQNYLLELKVAGMRELDHAGYLRFLGVRDGDDRLATYQRIRGELGTGARSFFDAHPSLISDGVLFQGRLERYFDRLSRILQWTPPLGLRALFECEDIDQQRKWLRKLDTTAFRLFAETACRRSVLRAFSGDPGFYRYVPREVALHRVIYAGVMEHFRHYLARDNPLMQTIFFGRIIHESALPHYLHAQSYERVRAALAKVKLVTITASMDQALEEAGPAAFDALSLSDISSYLDDVAHDQLFAAVLDAARPGAILCSRSNIHHRPLLHAQAARLQRERALEHELSISDHSCVHKFLIGRVV